MHRFILGAKKHQLVDHVNGNPLDNRLTNLRIANKSQNAANRGLDKNNTTGYKGVSQVKKTGRYRATIRVKGKNIHIGIFALAKDAAVAYKQMAFRYFGEFAWLNKI